eukprot:CAMPEP_0196691396 /NCGR_PEP_ID=MMETSP1090-20130531/23800_1 /TAXON_ID=37098 /ORGANISM="Isochrysis sp, Strain CCMP1244" /LENGTH=80 /DNA_ID=CAMNT_0042030643 /DNA_START=267 /DNA_END=509 /DNA_ORIENTATION=+
MCASVPPASRASRECQPRKAYRPAKANHDDWRVSRSFSSSRTDSDSSVTRASSRRNSRASFSSWSRVASASAAAFFALDF